VELTNGWEMSMQVERELLTAREVQQMLGLGLSKVYDMMARGELPTLRIGRLVRVPRSALMEWMASRTRSGGSSGRVEAA
jgi:excisionase family DNA binding protein